MTSVLEINQLHELQRHASLWRGLLDHTPGATFFQSLEWLGCYWRHFGNRQTFRVLLVQDKTRTVGILPLLIATDSNRLGSFRLLTYPLRDWSTFYGPIGPDRAATLTAGLLHVVSTPRHWDILDLRSTDRRIDNHQTPLAMQRNGLSVDENIWMFTDLVDIRGSWDDYLNSRSSKLRNNLRRCQRRAESLGDVSYERYRPAGRESGDGDPNWSLYDECLDLSSRTWQGTCPSATSLTHADVREFFRDCHQAAAHFGAVDVNVLRINGRMAAFNYNYHFRGTVSGVRMGYDPDFASISPGSLLFARTLKDSFERGDLSLDLGTDRHDYKRNWRTNEVQVIRYAYYRPTSPRTQLLRWKRQLFPTLAATNKLH